LANPDLGTKQVCPNCQSKFYDLNRRPAHCPKCDTEFDPEEAVRSRRARTRSAAPDYEADDEAPKKAAETEEGFEEQDDTPEIDEAIEADPVESDDAEEGAAPAGPEPDLGVDFEEEEGAEVDADSEDVPFLEEEEEDFGDEEIDRHGEGDEDR
jgi:uncharacterized protein (TIGR02300 family)